MELRKEILPQMNIAQKHYAQVLKSIRDYSQYINEYDDKHGIIYSKVEEYLSELTQKDLSQYNLSEWWEEEEMEVLAFRIALPDPLIVKHVSQEELTQVITKIKTFEDQLGQEEVLTFEQEFGLYLDEYYHKWLKLNFERYDYALFLRNRDKYGNYFEYSIQEIVRKLIGE
ncbi:hypothetical protein NWE55_15105 [Myroides albus]|uniref:Uncharacterized protein n=1 Tax=Myroides albus TaxID=2562892 RepID=A0A6I3LGR7_9FLAO|nr:hypothetical protein [Myroides albus]MTG97403.1 hypothetical protein [Myroides albus]UVD79432.1 hypothetical protein NWE55_15105 [Myroides albus]